MKKNNNVFSLKNVLQLWQDDRRSAEYGTLFTDSDLAYKRHIRLYSGIHERSEFIRSLFGIQNSQRHSYLGCSRVQEGV